MSTSPDPRPFLVVTAIVDQAARPAAVTCSHGDALQRAQRAVGERAVAGLDVVELPIAHPTFTALRDHFGRPKDTVAVYDLFPLAAHLDPAHRRTAAQFLAADVLWALDAQGQLGGIPLNVRLEVPSGWDRELKAVHERLMAVGALDLSPEAIETFKAVKAAWEALAPMS
jgi:hypothetical protein